MVKGLRNLFKRKTEKSQARSEPAKEVPKTQEAVKEEKPKVDSATAGLMTKGFPQPQPTRFEDANPWKPEKHDILYCMNGQDNVPSRMKLDDDFVYYVSQSRSPGHKDQGQDCMATALHGNWEIHLLCDGHDKMGHSVAMGICQELPKVLLRRIHERNTAEGHGDENEAVSDKIVNESFDEAARVVCWTSENITVGIWVKVFDGQWQDKPGYIKETNGQGKVRVAIIDENGYHLPSLEKSSLRRPRYTGGCTCLCLIRNKVTKECKVAVSGDSRMLILPTMGVQDAILLPQPGVEGRSEPTPQGLITPAHNVFNEEERERLERDFPGQYEFDGNFLVNPITKFAIQPTRGFGDFDMYGTGYTHRPEITKTFLLQPNALIFSASDGVFDTHVWADEEIVSCLDKYIADGLTSAQIVDNMYRETLQRSLEGGYVDDISIYCFREPPAGAEPVVKEEKIISDADLPTAAKVKLKTSKKDAKKNRKTIGRGEDSFQNINEQMEALRQERLKKAETDKKEAGAVEKLKDVVTDEQVLKPVGNAMRKMAESLKVADKVDPKKVFEDDEAEVAEKPNEEAQPPQKEASTEDSAEDTAAADLI